eukprot:m.192704 g.192704  ORF g.192704 m.192704 type:complete len:798 (-) comp18728_c0_seq1:123-2516(-)
MKDDLILLAEFDEVTGPRPLSWIPRHADSWLDLDQFAVKIMSVDTNTASGRDGGSFTVNEDSQIMLTVSQVSFDADVKVTAYVRHFTLYDLPARGFVRPMCLCYITASSDKILKYFKELSSALFKACRLMKFGNQYKFLADLDERSTALQHTAELLTSKAERELNDSTGGSPDAAARSATIAEQQASVRQALADINMVKNEILSRAWDEEFKKRYRLYVNPTAWSQQLRERQKRMSPDGRDRSRTLGRTSFTTSGEPSSPIQIPPHRESSSSAARARSGSVGRDRSSSFNTGGSSSAFDGSGGHGGVASVAKSPTYITGITKSLENSYQTKLQSVEELCIGFYRLAYDRMQKTLQCFRLDNTVLLMHSDEAHLMQPGPHMLTIGRCSVMNFSALPRGRHGGEGVFTASRVGGGEPGKGHNELADVLPRVPSSQSLMLLSGQTETSDRFDTTSRLREAPRSANPRATSPGNNKVPPAGSRLFMSSTISRYETGSVKSTEVSSAMRTSLNIGKRVSGYVQSAGEHVALDPRYKPGGGLLELRDQCSFLPHVVYSLLSGRPVVVLATPRNESRVRELIRTLWLFVPGHSENEKVISWRQSVPLQLAELNRIRLIGLSKNIHNPLSKTVERFVTKIDFEKEMFYGPPYGKRTAPFDIVGRMLLMDHDVPSESALIAHVHAEFLRVATVAFLYFHEVCLANTTDKSGVGQRPDEPRGMLAWTTAQRRKQSAFFKRHQIGPCDANIVEYLAGVVKQQQIVAHATAVGADVGPILIQPSLEELVRIPNETGPICTLAAASMRRP